MLIVWIVLTLFLLLAFSGTCYGAYRIYTAIKRVERELIEEVSTTKEGFQHMVNELLPDQNKPKGRRVIDAEEIN